jgi:hypothetical protein
MHAIWRPAASSDVDLAKSCESCQSLVWYSTLRQHRQAAALTDLQREDFGTASIKRDNMAPAAVASPPSTYALIHDACPSVHEGASLSSHS